MCLRVQTGEDGGRVGDRLHVSVPMHERVSVIRVGRNTHSLFRFIDLCDLSAGPRCFIETHQHVREDADRC